MRSIAIALPILLAIASPALAQGQASERRVRAMLSGYEHVPGERAWRALGSGTAEVLIELYEGRAEPGFVRLRALGALAHFPSPRTRAFLVRVARDAQAHPLFVRRAVLSLGHAFGRDAMDTVAPFLDHAEPIVRRAAARALRHMRSGEADDKLRARLEREPDPVVRRAIRRLLRDRPESRPAGRRPVPKSARRPR